MAYKAFLVFSLLLVLSTVNAVDYSVVDNTGNSVGGRLFRGEIGGVSYGTQTLSSATDFIWKEFRQNNPSDRKPVQKITMFIEENGDYPAYTTGDEIHFNAGYIGSFSGDKKTEFTGIIYHETTHVWQWNGAGRAPSWLIEGIADFVRLRAGYPAGNWVGPGQGDSWEQSYGVTGRFLDYCNGVKDGFVAELNKKMRDGYNDSFFVELLGKDLNQLWTDYKAKYGQ